MTAPAGPCEWCGGPQQWTFIRGELFVRCKKQCSLELDLEGFGTTPPISDEGLGPLRCPLEPLGNGGVVAPMRGDDSNRSIDDEDDLPF